MGIVTTNNIYLGQLIKPIPYVIGAGTTISGIGNSQVTINPASLNSSLLLEVPFEFGYFEEEKPSLIMNGVSGNLILNSVAGQILNRNNQVILDQAGSILQVVSSSNSTEVVVSALTWTDTELVASITPKRDDSAILVIVNQQVSVTETLAATANILETYCGIRISANDQIIHNPVANGIGPYDFGLAADVDASSTLELVDLFSRLTITKVHLHSAVGGKKGMPIEYKTQIRPYKTGNVANVNFSDTIDGSSHIMLIEIAS